MSTVYINIIGGLGNQLFQIAAAYAYSRRENGSLQIFRKKDNHNRPLYWDTIFKKLAPYLVENIPNSLHQWHEKDATIYTDIGSLPYNGIYLNGYLQSSKYFYNDSIKREIKDLFAPDSSIIQEIKNKYKFLCNNSERVIVIHARRTDYITHKDVHGPLSGNYYKEALAKIINRVTNPIFVLSSDDNNFWDEIKEDIACIDNYQRIFLANETDINTFILLQQFNNFIMSNSTLIWFVFWLAYARNVIGPSKWFGPAGPSRYEDIYEDNWERI
jgi:hypothetical protein